MKVMNGTISMPPPMPSKPARKPVQVPSRASSRISKGSGIMGSPVRFQKENASDKAGDGGIRCLQCHRTGSLNRGSGGPGQPGVGFI
jgi:hypothetical protein